MDETLLALNLGRCFDAADGGAGLRGRARVSVEVSEVSWKMSRFKSGATEVSGT
jgi:hypothetical protein